GGCAARAAPGRAWRGAAGSWQGTHVLRDCGAPQAEVSQEAHETDERAQTTHGVVQAADPSAPGVTAHPREGYSRPRTPACTRLRPTRSRVTRTALANRCGLMRRRRRTPSTKPQALSPPKSAAMPSRGTVSIC